MVAFSFQSVLWEPPNPNPVTCHTAVAFCSEFATNRVSTNNIGYAGTGMPSRHHKIIVGSVCKGQARAPSTVYAWLLYQGSPQLNTATTILLEQKSIFKSPSFVHKK